MCGKLPSVLNSCGIVWHFYVWFKYDLGQKYHAPQVQPCLGLNSYALFTALCLMPEFSNRLRGVLVQWSMGMFLSLEFLHQTVERWSLLLYHGMILQWRNRPFGGVFGDQADHWAFLPLVHGGKKIKITLLHFQLSFRNNKLC